MRGFTPAAFCFYQLRYLYLHRYQNNYSRDCCDAAQIL